MATSRSAREFKVDLDKAFTDEVERPVIAIAQKLAMEALNRVVLKSPVDVGRFRGNWTVAVGSPNLKNDFPPDKGGAAVIARETPHILAVKDYAVIWVSNNVPYAEALENGHSQQAPAGVVAVTFAELSTIVGLTP